MTAISDDAVIYLRVSTKDQAERGGEVEGFSIPAQRDACYRKAEQLEATVAAEFLDAGESARSAARPDLQRMLAYLVQHPTKYVIVHKVDRLARNRADDVEINLAIQRAGSTLVSVTENIDETPSGMLLHGIRSSIAEFYSRNLASEVTKGLSQKAQAGGTVSIAPIGYRNVRITDDLGRDVRTVEVDPERAPLIRWAFDTYADGEWSTAMLLEELTLRGLTTRPTPKRPAKPLTISGMHKLLANPYYMGEVVYRGVRYPGRHAAIVTAATWQRVQAVRAAHNSAGDRQQAHDHYLKGSVFCGSCDSRLVITHSTNRHGVTYPYFICSGRHRKRTACTRQAVLIDWVERQIERDYAGIELPAQVAQAMVDMLSHDLADIHRSGERERQQLQRERDRLRDEQARLLQAHYASAVPLDLLKREQTRISSQLVVLGQRLDGADTEHARVQANLHTCTAYLQDCQTAYLNASPAVRRQLNQAFFDKIYVDEDGTVRFGVAEPFTIVLDPQVRSAALTTGTSADLSEGTPELSETGDSGKGLAGHQFGQGLNKTTMVELTELFSRPSMRTLLAELDVELRGLPVLAESGVRSDPHQAHQLIHRLGDERLTDIVTDYVAGTSSIELAKRHGIGKASVLRLLHERGVAVRNQPLCATDVQTAVKLYQAGWSLARVGQELKVSANTVRKALLAAGTETRQAAVQ